jgi:hypothetical protein
MKKILILLLLSLFFFTCGKKDEDMLTKKPDTKEQEATETAPTEKPTGQSESNADIDELPFDKNNLPKEIVYNGTIVTGKHWKDNNGENITIICTTKEKVSKDEYSESVLTKEIYAYNYVNSGKGFVQYWKMYDFVKECPFDISIDYVENSLSLTDIDKNGIAEVTYMYTNDCRSDVSPAGLKLMMYESKTKYALRGMTRIDIEEKDGIAGIHEGGTYETDKSFNSAPPGFLDYAKSHWKKYMTEKFDN